MGFARLVTAVDSGECGGAGVRLSGGLQFGEVVHGRLADRDEGCQTVPVRLPCCHVIEFDSSLSAISAGTPVNANINTFLAAVTNVDLSDPEGARAAVIVRMLEYLPSGAVQFLLELSIDPVGSQLGAR